MAVMKMMKRLNEVYPNWLNGNGVFADLSSLAVPWADSVDALSLDLDYFGNHSGDKWVSPLVDKLTPDTELTVENRVKLANVIFAKNNENWVRLWDALHEKYDPLQNYNGNEEYTRTVDETGTDTFLHTGTDKTESDGTSSNTRTGNETIESSGTDTNKKTGTDKLEQSGTDTNKRTGSDTTTSTGTDTNKNDCYGR